MIQVAFSSPLLYRSSLPKEYPIVLDAMRKSADSAVLKVMFVAITVDPERDTADVLRSYAQAHGARGAGWAFLTGTPAEIKDVTQRYGVFARKTDRGDVDHTFLTSLVDRDGALRVQYMGVRFDPDEMLRDLRSLLREGGR